jgi:hypothetical protein
MLYCLALTSSGSAESAAPFAAAYRWSVGRQETAIHPHDTLIALAEVAAAFAGFSGVVATFGRRSPSDWSAAARFRFGNLLTTAVASCILAFLPVVLAHFPIAPFTVWAWSGAALAFFCLSFLVQLFRRVPKKTAEGRGLRRWMAVVWVGGMGGAALAQLANIAASSEGRGGAPYVAGILVLLAISGLQFIVLALSSVSHDP